MQRIFRQECEWTLARERFYYRRCSGKKRCRNKRHPLHFLNQWHLLYLEFPARFQRLRDSGGTRKDLFAAFQQVRQGFESD